MSEPLTLEQAQQANMESQIIMLEDKAAVQGDYKILSAAQILSTLRLPRTVDFCTAIERLEARGWERSRIGECLIKPL